MGATFTVRAATSKQVKKAVAKLSLPKNDNGQYTHNAILILKKQITRILAAQFYDGEGEGMKELMSKTTNTMCKIKSTHKKSCGSIIKASQKAADAENPKFEPAITSRGDAQEEVDHQNIFTQAVLGVKGGVTEGITNLVGSNITDAVLQTSDGTDFKGIDEYQLYELFEAIDGEANQLQHRISESNYRTSSPRPSISSRRLLRTSSDSELKRLDSTRTVSPSTRIPLPSSYY